MFDIGYVEKSNIFMFGMKWKMKQKIFQIKTESLRKLKIVDLF